MKRLAKRLLMVLAVGMLVSCGYHPPAPIDEQSSTPVKRPLNSGGTYRVSTGDTLYAIAFRYGLDHRDVAAWNGIPSPYVIYPGQSLILSARSSAVQTAGIKSPGEATTRTRAESTPPSNAKAASHKHPATSAAGSKTAKPSSPRATSRPGSADPKSWKWPTNGRVLRGYVAGNPSRNGLDILGKEGQPIKASAAGTVVYSGNGLIAYGELIIIKHSEKMLSAYAHNKVRLVREGEQVSAGQKIAEMGRNDQNEQLLHFEIRTNGKPVNPLKYLPKK